MLLKLLLPKSLNRVEAFDKELEGSMKAKNLASSKLSTGEAWLQDMASKIIIAEQRLKDLEEKKRETRQGYLEATYWYY